MTNITIPNLTTNNPQLSIISRNINNISHIISRINLNNKINEISNYTNAVPSISTSNNIGSYTMPQLDAANMPIDNAYMAPSNTIPLPYLPTINATPSYYGTAPYTNYVPVNSTQIYPPSPISDTISPATLATATPSQPVMPMGVSISPIETFDQINSIEPFITNNNGYLDWLHIILLIIIIILFMFCYKKNRLI